VDENTARRWMTDGTITCVTAPDAFGIPRRYARLSVVMAHKQRRANRILLPDLAETLDSCLRCGSKILQTCHRVSVEAVSDLAGCFTKALAASGRVSAGHHRRHPRLAGTPLLWFVMALAIVCFFARRNPWSTTI
jgi:hypothetical protein